MMTKYLKNEVREILVYYKNTEITLSEAITWIGEAIDDDRIKRNILKNKAKTRLALRKSIKEGASNEAG